MTATIRIALTYFSVVPLQRWTSGIGAALMLLALVIRATSNPAAGRDIGMVLLMFGGVLVLMVPLILGGAMMRAASTRIILHQRPRGRQRMLLGATLAVVLLTVGCALLFTFVESQRPPRFSRTPVLEVVALAWSAVSIIWLCVFIATGNRLLSALLGFVPLAFIKFGRTVFSETPDAWLMVTASAAMWAGFSLWYLHASSIRRMVYSKERLLEAYDNPVNRFFRWAAGADRSASRAHAMEQYLLGTPQGHALMGVVWVLTTALIHLLFRSFFSSENPGLAMLQVLVPFVFLPVVIITCGGMGFWLTRRARVLWLRAGLDRMALFRKVERSGLAAGMLSSGIVLAAILLYCLAKWPGHRETILVLLVVQIVFLVCLFYGGLSLTRGWVALDVLLCVGLCALLAGQIILLRPWSGEPSANAPFVLAAMVTLAAVLRWHARRRWLALDWRVARALPMQMTRPA